MLRELRSPQRHRGHGGLLGWSASLVLSGLVLLGACGTRRDVADMAVGVAPFEQLRGIDVLQLRSGGVRALRSAAVPAPFEGLREPVGEYDVLYAIPGFDGSDGSWPSEDALVHAVEAVHEWPTDTLAEGAWKRSMRELQAGLGVAPTCATLGGQGFSLRIAEWDAGGGWSVSTTYAASVSVATDTAVSARHSIAVRRRALTAQYPQAGAKNDDDLPTWASASCSGPASAAVVEASDSAKAP